MNLPNIPETLLAIARDYPFSFSVIVADWLTLAICGFWFSLVFVVVGRTLHNLSLIGLSRSEITKAELLSKDKEGNILPLRWGQKANLDYPPKRIYAKRWFARVFMLAGIGVFAGVVIVYIVIVISFLIINFDATNKLLLSSERFYPLAWLLGSLVVGMYLSSFFYFAFIQNFIAKIGSDVNKCIIQKSSKSNFRTGELSDARSLNFSDIPDFNPIDYFDMAMDKDAVFLGLDENRSPIYIPRKTWMKSNIQIMGSVGSGKGVLACCALAQCASAFNDAVILFDPKNDEFAPHVLKGLTDNFVMLDLRQGKPAQLNIFRDLSSFQLNELLVSGFSLGRRGDNADFYRDNDRQAARLLSSQFESGTDVASLLDAAQKLPQKVRESASGFIMLLQELCSLSVLQAKDGIDLKDIILNGGCLYVVGSLRDESVIMLQKMLFVRCLQIIEDRDRFEQTTHVNIMLDEFKYLLSKSSLEALGTVRDKNCNILLTHQSLGDFGQCGADMKPEVAQATVIDNTPIKWIYRMKDYKVAEWISKQTGQILVDSERRNVSTETGNVELMSTDLTVSKEKRELIDTNTIQHLPDGVAVMVGIGLARIAYSKPIKTVRQPISLHEYPTIKLPDINFLPGKSDEPQTSVITADSGVNSDIEAEDTSFEQTGFKQGDDNGWR